MSENPYAPPEVDMTADTESALGVTAVSPYGPFRKVKPLQWLIVTLLSGHVILSIIQIEIRRMQNHTYPLDDVNKFSIEAFDRLTEIYSQLENLQIGLYYLTGIIWLLWISGSIKNTWLLMARCGPLPNSASRKSLGWSIAYHILPVVCLWKPYGIMTFIQDNSETPPRPSWLVSIWWISWLTWTSLGLLNTLYLMGIETYVDVVAYHRALMINHLIGIFSAVCAAIVIVQTTSGQYRAFLNSQLVELKAR